MREAVLQLLRLHANFTRTKTVDDFAVELVKNFIDLTAPQKQKLEKPRQEEKNKEEPKGNEVPITSIR